jgi:alpha-L-fucosidase 2
MIAVYPGRQISPITTPELAEAAKVSMSARGDGGTGWSKAWKISIWARLHDGNRAYELLSGMMRKSVYDNLFATHPPFQIDGNFGYAAGVCEMLMHSHMGHIHLLPALPDAWATGGIRGLRARGGFEVDMAWTDGQLTKAEILSRNGRTCRLRSAQSLTVMKGNRKVMAQRIQQDLIEFPTEQNEKYEIIPQTTQ